MTSQLFSPISLRGLTLANRVVLSPMCQYSAEHGSAGDWHLMNLGQYAMGAAGLVFTEACHVSAVGRITPRCLGLYSDANEAALKRVIDFCKEYGVAAIGIQLAHAGRKASTHTPAEGRHALGADEDPWETVAPSALPYDPTWHTPRALDEGGMAEVKAEFVAATERAARLDVEVIEVHMAHGYLMHQFLSPLSNRREDAYGGPLEHRMRFPLEVFEAVRAVWPDDKPIGVRVSATDWVAGGWTPEETVVLSKELKGLGCDFMDVSSGGLDPAQKMTTGPGYQVRFAAKVRAEVDIPTMAVGMITEPHQAEEIVASGQADFVALARGMMYNPRWAWHAAQALGAETPYAPNYVRCHPSAFPVAYPGGAVGA
jgi:2,4-dienoyl-CoA reductase-like NADH-dependent reductase (Old Yellow Enzyme family)